ncbi:MAG: hypothetical protein HKM04_01065 [Legionellales bacterium]|nr:hypothetical protein [Legionellales bacterium]
MPHLFMCRLSIVVAASLFVCSSFASSTPAAADNNVIPVREQAIANLLLGEMAIDRDQIDSAHHYYMVATNLSHDPDTAKRALYLALMAGQPGAALNAAKEWAALAPNSLEAQLINVDLLLKTGQASACLPYIQQALKINSHETINTLVVEFQQAPLTIQQAMLAAIKTLSASQQASPDFLLLSSFLQFQTGSQKQAYSSINQALTQKPNWVQAIALKTDFLVHDNQPDQALQFTAAKAKSYPDDTMIQLIDAEMLIKANQNAAATAKLQQLAKLPKMRGIALLSLAQLAIQEQKISEASLYLKEATSDPEQASSAYYLLAEIYQFENKPDLAIDAYQRVTNGEHYVSAQLRAVALLASAGKNKQALSHLADIKIQNMDQARQVVLLQVELLINMHQYKVALNALNKAITSLPDDIPLLYARAMVTNMLKDNVQTEKDLKQIIKIDPKQASALNALGYLLITTPPRYQEALKYTNQALAISPKDPAILDTMGWLQYHLGNYHSASNYLAEAYKLDNDPLITAHYGAALWAVGNKPEAEAIWQSGLKKFPNDPDLQQMITQLSRKTQ